MSGFPLSVTYSSKIMAQRNTSLRSIIILSKGLRSSLLLISALLILKKFLLNHIPYGSLFQNISLHFDLLQIEQCFREEYV